MHAQAQKKQRVSSMQDSETCSERITHNNNKNYSCCVNRAGDDVCSVAVNTCHHPATQPWSRSESCSLSIDHPHSSHRKCFILLSGDIVACKL